MMLGLALLLGSCKSEEPADPGQTRSVEVPVSFTIRLATENGGTRAAGDDDTTPTIWEEGENHEKEGGTSFDNKIVSILPAVYKVTDNTMEATPSATMKYLNDPEPKKDANGNVLEGQYVVSGIMTFQNTSTDAVTSGDYRLALYINCGAGDMKTALNPASAGEAMFYHHGIPGANKDASFGSKTFNSIPMYGVAPIIFEKTNGFIEAKGTSANNEISVNVLRSMAKVRVVLADGIKDKVNLTSLGMNRHALKGYVCPKGWNKTGNVAGLSSTEYMRAAKGDANSYNHNCLTTDETNFSGATWANSSNRIRFYLPETYNRNRDDIDGSEELKLTIKYDILDNGKKFPKEHDMYFREWSTWNNKNYKGDSWDIIRNHIYEFVITDVEPTTGKLIVNVAVKPWEKHELTEWWDKFPDPAN